MFMRHLVLVILCRLLSGMQGGMGDSHLHRITSNKCSINTAVPPDDGSRVARNMQRLINILRIHVHQFGFIYKTKNYCIRNYNTKPL